MSIVLRLVATMTIIVATFFFWVQGYLTQKPEAIITWSTESEVGTAGFHVYRANQEDGPYEQVTQNLIESKGDPFTGGEYEFRDSNVKASHTYFYQLEELETTGSFIRLPDIVRFEARSGIYGFIDHMNWNVLSILLLLLFAVWLWPQRAKKTSTNQEPL